MCSQIIRSFFRVNDCGILKGKKGNRIEYLQKQSKIVANVCVYGFLPVHTSKTINFPRVNKFINGEISFLAINERISADRIYSQVNQLDQPMH